MTPQRMAGSVTRQKVRQSRRAQRVGGLLLVGADLAQHRHDLADDERQRHEDGRQDHARHGEDDLEADVVQEPAEPAVLAVDQEQRQADDHRRERERQVDERVEERLAGEPAAHERERRDDPEDGVDGHGDGRDLAASARRLLERRPAEMALSTGSRPCSNVRKKTMRDRQREQQRR